MRSLIQQWFPAGLVGAESLRERGASSALPPINFLHVWWARRPLTASRAALLASVLPAWPSPEDVSDQARARQVLEVLRREFPGGEEQYHGWFVRTLGILGDPVSARARIRAANARKERLEDGGYGYPRAFTVSPDDATIERIHRLARVAMGVSDPLVVLDPFAGGGAIPFEASRFGFSTIAGELNPVATAILHGTVDLPAQLGPAFASVIESYGNQWSDAVAKRLRPFFPKGKQDAAIIGYVWAHTVPCPTTGLSTPLVPDSWLSKEGGQGDVAIKLRPDKAKREIRVEVVRGEAARRAGPVSTYKEGTATSVWEPHTFSGEYIREQAVAGRVGAMLLAIVYERASASGRQFREPRDEDRAAAAAATGELARRLPRWRVDGLVPDEEIFEGKETTRSVRMGLLRWSQMFTDRQLLANLTALEEHSRIVSQVRADRGADDARAVGLYLALALDKAVDYNSMLSSWDASRNKIRNTFDRHDFAYKQTFAEFDGADSLIPWGVSQVVDAYAGIAKLARRPRGAVQGSTATPVHVRMGSATSLGLPDASVDAVITDPPYYDNVMYAECSDFFYVWLKRSLRESWPELCRDTLTNKEDEAVANPSLFRSVATHTGRGKRAQGAVTAGELADRRYEELLTRSFKEAHRVLRPAGTLTVMFTHKRVDAWDTLGAALLNAGFSIHSSWPVHTESEHSLHQAKKNAASSTILLTCRPRLTSEPAYWSDIRDDVAKAVRGAVRDAASAGLTGIDLTLATFGPALAVLSRRWPVHTGELGADGRPQVLRPDVALDLAREEVARLKKRGLLGGREVEFDRPTDWYLLAWSDFGAATFPSGEALKLSIATHLELDDLLRKHRLIKGESGNVTLLTPAQRRTAKALDTSSSSWPTKIDALHTLMLIHEEDGLRAARAWLERTGLRDDARFADLVASALRAIPRIRANGHFVIPEADVLEKLRVTLFDRLEAPKDEAPLPEQLGLSV